MKLYFKTLAGVLLVLLFSVSLFGITNVWAAPSPRPVGIEIAPADIGTAAGSGSTTACPLCEDLTGYLSSQITAIMDDRGKNFDVSLTIQDSGAPVANAPLIVYIKNQETGVQNFYTIYTGSNGIARFNFASFATECHDYRFFYCYAPSGCGFAKCMSAIGADAAALGYSGVTDIPAGAGSARLGGAQTPAQVLSSYGKPFSYCPPPGAITTTPVFCFPILLLFALLGGSLFLSGRNPLSAFDFSTPRMGKYVKYTARARGMGFDTGSILSGAITAVGAAKAAGTKDSSATGYLKAIDAQNAPAAGGIFTIGTSATKSIGNIKMVKDAVAGSKAAVATRSAVAGQPGTYWQNVGAALKESGMAAAKVISPVNMLVNSPIGRTISNIASAAGSAYAGSKGFASVFVAISKEVLRFSSLGSIISAYDQASTGLKVYGSVNDANKQVANFKEKADSGAVLERAKIAIATDSKGNKFVVSSDENGKVSVFGPDGKTVAAKDIPKSLAFSTYSGERISVSKDAKGNVFLNDAQGKKVDAALVLGLAGALQFTNMSGTTYIVQSNEKGETTLKNKNTGEAYTVSKDAKGNLQIIDAATGKIARNSDAFEVKLSLAEMAPLVAKAMKVQEKALRTIALFLPKDANIAERKENLQHSIENIVRAGGGTEKMETLFANKLENATHNELKGRKGEEREKKIESLLTKVSESLGMSKTDLAEQLKGLGSKDAATRQEAESRLVKAYSIVEGASFAKALFSGSAEAANTYFSNPKYAWLVEGLAESAPEKERGSMKANLVYAANEAVSIRLQENVINYAAIMSQSLSELGKTYNEVLEAKTSLDEARTKLEEAKKSASEQTQRGEKTDEITRQYGGVSAREKLKGAELDYAEASHALTAVSGGNSDENSVRETMANISRNMVFIDSKVTYFTNDAVAQVAVAVATVPAFKEYPNEVRLMHANGLESAVSEKEASAEKLIALANLASKNPSADLTAFEGAGMPVHKPEEIAPGQIAKAELDFKNGNISEAQRDMAVASIGYEAQKNASEQEKKLWRTVFQMTENYATFAPVIEDAKKIIADNPEKAAQIISIVFNSSQNPERFEKASELLSKYADAKPKDREEIESKLLVLESTNNVRDDYRRDFLVSTASSPEISKKVQDELVQKERKKEEDEVNRKYSNEQERTQALGGVAAKYDQIEQAYTAFKSAERAIFTPKDAPSVQRVEEQAVLENKEVYEARKNAYDSALQNYARIVVSSTNDGTLGKFLNDNMPKSQKADFEAAEKEFGKFEKEISSKGAVAIINEQANPFKNEEKYKVLAHYSESFQTSIVEPSSISKALPAKWKYELGQMGLIKQDYAGPAARKMRYDSNLKVMVPE